MAASTRNAVAARSVAADSFVVTLRPDSFDLTPAQPGDCARLYAEVSALSSISTVWTAGLSRNPAIVYDAQQQPRLTSNFPHSSPKWSLLSAVEDRRHIRAFASVIATLLQHWHALGVVHRSLSPSSVIVDLARSDDPDENSVVLLSWGGFAAYNWSQASYVCCSPFPHPSPHHAPPERLSFSFDMFAPLTPGHPPLSPNTQPQRVTITLQPKTGSALAV
jgi:hypothetical protein